MMLSRDQEAESSLLLSKEQVSESLQKLSRDQAENSKRLLSSGHEAESSERLSKDAEWLEEKREEARWYLERPQPQVGRRACTLMELTLQGQLSRP